MLLPVLARGVWWEVGCNERVAAWDLGDPVPEKVKTDRRDEIMALQEKISARNLKEWIGRRIDVLLEGPLEKRPGFWIGRAASQAPEVDGVVFVSGAGPEAGRLGALRRVEITGSGSYDLQGAIVE